MRLSRQTLNACYAPGTSQQYMQHFESLIHPEPGPNTFNDSNRWTQTATDGAAAGFGQPITLTYSFPPDNDTGDPATSNVLHALLDAQFGSRDAWKALFADIFADWSAVTGITYVETSDDGALWPDSGGQLNLRGDIRLVSFAIDGLNNVLAFNYFPNGGDLALDSAENWADSSSDFIFVRNVVMHEMGHGIGLGHTLPRDGTKLMEAFINVGFVGPQDDDLRGAGFFYGDTNEPNDSAPAATDPGAVATTTIFTNIALHNAVDQDWYRFTVTGQQTMSVTAAPIGGAYSVGPDPGTATAIDTRTINALTVEVYDATGSTLLQSRTGALGESATTAPIAGQTASDVYFVRVLTADVLNDVQRYELTVALGEANVLNVQSTPVTGVLIDVSPADANGATSGSTGFSRSYATGASVQLTAPGVSGFQVFSRWVIAGVGQPDGQNVVTVVMPTAGATARAEYADPNALTAYAGSDDEIIAGEQAVLNGTAAGGDPPLAFVWTPDAALSSPQSTQTIATPTVTTTYTLRVTDAVGRSATDTVTLRVVEPIAVDAGADQTVLANQTFVVTGAATGGTLPYSYAWSPTAALDAATNQSAFGKTLVDTTLTLTVTDAKGRSGSDMLNITLAAELLADAGQDQTVTLGAGTNLTASVSGGVEPYAFVWIPGGIPATADNAVIRVEPSQSTDYELVVTDALGQRADDIVSVNVVSPIVVTTGDASAIQTGDVVVLNGSAAGGQPPYRYLWSPATGLSDASAARPQASPDQTTIYTLVVTDDAGSSSQASITITVAAEPPPVPPAADTILTPAVGPCGAGLLPVLPLTMVLLIPFRANRRFRRR